MLHRLAKGAVTAALFVAAAADPAVGMTSGEAPNRQGRVEAGSPRQIAVDAPGWLAWLRSIVLGDEPPIEVGSDAGEQSEDDESDAGPSMDPNG